MNEMKLDWADLKLFLAVARGGGLAAGALTSNMSPATLGRHMVALERALGEVLFTRLPRGYELTEAGADLLGEAEEVETQVRAIERRRNTDNASLPINITAGTWMTRFLTQQASELQKSGGRLVFLSTEKQHHIGRREATIGLRNRRPTELALTTQKVSQIVFAPYGTPEAIKGDNWINSRVQTPSAEWVNTHKASNVQIEVSHPRTLLDLACQGLGQVVLPCFIGDQEGTLVRSGAVIDALTHDQWLVVHSEDLKQPAVRRTVDCISTLIRANRSAFLGRV